MLTIQFIKGDALSVPCDMVCHQTNCLGVMGGGIALQVKKQYPFVYEQYAKKCKEEKALLGTSQLICCVAEGKIIANLFGQNGIGNVGCQTDYEAFRTAYESALVKLYNHNKPASELVVAVPYKIGCGLAGGDWNIVQNILINTTKYFMEDYKVNVVLKIVEFIEK